MVENLKEDQIIPNTFIAEDPIKPRAIKISYKNNFILIYYTLKFAIVIIYLLIL